MFFECQVERLENIVPTLRRKDQTLTWFGFAPQELKDLATTLNGRALDRIVPIGQALQFGRFWDGNDLLQSFCRQLFIGGGNAVARMISTIETDWKDRTGRIGRLTAA